MSHVPGFDRITLDAEVMGGKPCIRGMRVTVGMIVGLLAEDELNAGALIVLNERTTRVRILPLRKV